MWGRFFPRKRSTKQTFTRKTFSTKTVYKTSLHQKNILHENGLQNKPFTKTTFSKKTLYDSTKQAFRKLEGGITPHVKLQLEQSLLGVSELLEWSCAS